MFCVNCGTKLEHDSSFCVECGIKIGTVEDNVRSNEWYYELKGKRLGPVSSNEIINLLKHNTIESSTLVWTKEFDNWKVVSQTEFRSNIDQPPPLVGDKVDNTFIWLLALSPLIGLIIEIMLFDYRLIPTDWELFGIYFFLNSSLAIIDDIKLKNAGYKSNNLVWAIFIVPVYIWRRATLTKQSRTLFWFWLFLIVINMIVTQVLWSTTLTSY